MTMKCSHCDTTEFKVLDSIGWPMYYFGAGPNNPQDAEVYFCGPHCASAYQKQHKSDITSK